MIRLMTIKRILGDVWVGQPRTLSHKENSELRQKGVMKPHEVAWESACGTLWIIRNNKTSGLRTVRK